MQKNSRFINEPLPYPYQAMEPYIDIQTMYLHHAKHLQAYIDKLNGLIDQHAVLQTVIANTKTGEKEPCGFPVLIQILGNLDALPKDAETAVKNNAGGVFNHWFYFNGLSAHPQGKPKGMLAQNIQWQFGSLAQFQKKFAREALDVFGSGYAWLVSDPDGRLEIIKTANQDTPPARGLAPVVCIDVWEHAYYLKHKNLRKDYIPDWFAVLNWKWAQWCYENRELFLV